MKIKALLYDSENETLSSGGQELITDWRSKPNTVLWIDIARDDIEAERQLMTNTFNLHPLAVEDALRERHPPKIELFENCMFILLRGLDAKTTGIDFGVIQLALFIGERFLLTRHNKESASVGLMREAVQKTPGIMARGAGALAVGITNKLIRRYLEILLSLEPRLEELEQEIFEMPDDEQLHELTKHKSKLRQLNRIANYHLQVAHVMGQQSNRHFVPEDLEHEVVDVYEQLERTSSLATLYYEMASDLTDGYLGHSSHRLNRVMQTLTIVTVIFVPLTFIAGIYGMNFENMPELSSANGYFIVVGVMAVISTSLMFFFKHKHWM